MAAFDYGSEAELFPTRNSKSRAKPIGYRRFARAADAIRFAIEDLPRDLLTGAYLQVEDERFDCQGIRRLYEDAAYPLIRGIAATAQEARPGTVPVNPALLPSKGADRICRSVDGRRKLHSS